MRIILSLVVVFFMLFACKSDKKLQVEVQSNHHKVSVQEVIHVSEYTYLRVLENSNEKWLAVPSIQAEIGETYYFKEGMEMPNFKSKELNRTFKTIYFVAGISANPNLEIANTPNTMVITQQATKPKPIAQKELLTIAKVKGGITIGELFKNKKTYENKSVKISGKVTKFNAAIMNKNWIHLQDGTAHNNEFDLTVTSNEAVNVGDIITIEGKVTLDKDIGSGYFYSVLIEDAVILK